MDLADRFQTPVFVLLDLDIGMNDWLCEPFRWDDRHRMDRGKVMTAEELEAGRDFGRYLDVDGDGIPYRTYPGTHPARGSFFTRGTSRDRYAKYTEVGSAYVDNMERLLRKFATARQSVPRPVETRTGKSSRVGVLHYGSTGAAMQEALAALAEDGIHLDSLRIRAFPFHDEVLEFIARHERVFVVEQNRDAQLRTLLMVDGGVDGSKLVPVLHYDGTPITARFIRSAIAEKVHGLRIGPLHEVAAE